MCLKFTFSQSSRKVDPLRAVWNWGVTQIYHALLCFFPILFSDIACIFPRNVYQSQQQTSDQITLCRVPSSKPPSVPANVLYCHLILGSLFCHAPPAPRVLLRPQGGWPWSSRAIPMKRMNSMWKVGRTTKICSIFRIFENWKFRQHLVH